MPERVTQDPATQQIRLVRAINSVSHNRADRCIDKLLHDMAHDAVYDDEERVIALAAAVRNDQLWHALANARQLVELEQRIEADSPPHGPCDCGHETRERRLDPWCVILDLVYVDGAAQDAIVHLRAESQEAAEEKALAMVQTIALNPDTLRHATIGDSYLLDERDFRGGA